MLLDEMSSEEKTLFGEICKVKEYESGQEIIKEGEKGESLLLIRKGRVEVRKALDIDNYKHLKELSSGEFFGEMSFLNQSPRSASVITLDSCEILELNRKDFDLLVKANPGIGLKVCKSIAIELAARLKRNNDDLKKAVLWAIEGTDAN